MPTQPMQTLGLMMLCLAAGCARAASGITDELPSFDASVSAATDPSDAAAAAPDATLAVDAAEPAVDAGPPDAGPPDAGPLCTEENTCLRARAVGSLSGDRGSDRVEATGFESTFLTVTLTEDDHTPLVPKRLRVSGNLISTGADYDLFVYPEGRGCGGQVQESSNGGLSESFDVSWDDSQGIGGSDSGRTIMVEVRHREGQCDQTQPWTLTLRGN